MARRPAAVAWIGAYCLANAAFNLGTVVLAWMGFQDVDWILAQIAADVPRDVPEYGLLAGAVHQVLASAAVTGLVFAVLNAVLAFAPRTPKYWMVHAVNLGLGLLSCVCIPVVVPLGIAWLKPPVKAWYGNSSQLELR